ncbi:Serine/threonine-protein kinase PAK 5 [Sporothrix bragantina]|uniref:Serine/threonine-protein kinase PAK 5 n=1 Tax=Sporothrix bragantina TaxID=671064 RepID=A0ABP0CLD6_9PEZI
MDRRQSLAVPSQTKAMAIDEARRTQAAVLRDCASAGCDPPPYVLTELIGKGSFGRVFKATTSTPAKVAKDSTKDRPTVVAVKIISIEEGDAAATDAGVTSNVNAPPPTPSATRTANPVVVDTFGDVLKEIHTLQKLGASGARNINTVLDSMLVGPTVWMVTAYCAGGSVATLMRPTGYLPEKWIVPILREVAEALYWVHGQGIIHRDIKCANVLVTDVPDESPGTSSESMVQLCDFGVAGFVETAVDKRRTVTGTLHWMAPELFRTDVAYGTEVDIWAFGSMAYEVASGLPPNATMSANGGGRFDISSFGTYLEQNCPRLVGNQYSEGLKELVARCMVHDTTQRPSIAEVQRFPYIANTADSHPTSSLSALLAAHRLWLARGGGRQSLFSAGGARSAANIEKDRSTARLPDWDFGDDDDNDDDDDDDDDDSGDSFSLDFEASTLAVYEAYGISLDKSLPPTPKSQQQPPLYLASPPLPPQSRLRRRQPPANTTVANIPLAGVFDPNTLTSYRDRARTAYSRQPLGGFSSRPSDLPLRDYSSNRPNDRDSLIDLDLSIVADRGMADDQDDTIRRPTGSTPKGTARPRTQDWTFPVAVVKPPADEQSTLDSKSQPAVQTRSIRSTQDNRLSTASLIDLDAIAVGMNVSNRNNNVPENDTPFEFDTVVKSKAPIELPAVPLPPTRRVLQGSATRGETRDELLRMLSSLGEHLHIATTSLESLPLHAAHATLRQR